VPNVCAYDGWIVGPQREIPADTTQYCWLGRDPVVGCGHLRCSVCGQWVKQKPGFLIRGQLAELGTSEWRDRVDRLYDGDDWDSLPFMKREPTYRVYVCRCGPVEESFERALSMTSVDGNPDGGNPIPWTCQGHPVVALPATVGGIRILDDAALELVVRRALSGELPETGGSTRPADWLRTLLHRLEGSEAAETVRRIAREVLRGEDAGAMVSALEFFRSVQDPEAAMMIWELAKKATQFHTERDRPAAAVVDALVGSVAQLWGNELLANDAEARALVLQEATSGRGMLVLPSLVKRDVQWLRDHFAEVVRASPESGGAVITALFDALAYTGFAIEDVARTVASIPGVSREQLRTDVANTLFGVARTRVLDAIGTVPPN